MPVHSFAELESLSCEPRPVLAGHEDNHAIVQTTGPAGLIIDRLEGRGQDLKVVVGLDEARHVLVVPESYK